MPEDRDDLFSGLDAPRPLPASLRSRLEASMIDASAEASLLAGADAPRHLPARLRRRLELALVRPRVSGAPLAAMAAVVALLLGVASLAVVVGRGGREAKNSVALESESPTTDGRATVDTVAPDAAVASPFAAGAPASSPGAGAAAARSSGSGAPPPFAFGPGDTPSSAAAPARSEESGSASDSQAKTRRATGTPIRVGVIGGDAAQEGGFRAYVDLLNREGVNGRPLELVAASRSSRAAGTAVTVNLSLTPVAGAYGGPLLETMAVSESALRGDVFSFASAARRQGHLIADAVFPERASATAIVYAEEGAGVLADEVPAAIEEALRARGVQSRRSTWRRGQPNVLQPGDAAFLSLSTEGAREWLDLASRTAHSPARGVAGIYTLFEPSLALPEGTRVMSPYVMPSGEEASALARAIGAQPGAGAIHGWASAKSLAVALWQTGADEPNEVTAALVGLRGYDSGLAPPYEVRQGTRSRTPEGLLHEARGGAFTQRGGWRRDPH